MLVVSGRFHRTGGRTCRAAAARRRTRTSRRNPKSSSSASSRSGVRRGRVVEIYGPEASGKTTLTLHAVSAVQKSGGTAAFIDAEHALDSAWARICGVNIDELLISQPDNGEQALEITDTLVRSGAVD